VKLKERLTSDMKKALKEGDKLRLSTIRMLLALIKNAEIEKRGELTEGEVVRLLKKYAKQRREAIEMYRKGGRKELVEREEAELSIVESYLPKPITDEELRKLVEETIKELSATSAKDMGRVIGAVMEKAGGTADGAKVSALVRKLLSGK
jgi:uncharacterized protein YqeY